MAVFRTTGDWVRNDMSARVSYSKVSNWYAIKFKELRTSSKLDAACLTGTVTLSRPVGLASLHPAESAPIEGTGFYLGGQRYVHITREDD